MANSKADRFAAAALVRSFGGLAITAAQVANTTVPTLAIAGSGDPYLADLREMKEIRPSMLLMVIEGATHDGERGAMRRPEFVSEIRRFLTAHRRGVSR